MTTDQLKAWLDAHGVAGANGVTPGTWVGTELVGGHVHIGFVTKWRSILCVGGHVPDREVLRHAPLPDVAALLAEVEALRARVARVCRRCRGSGAYDSSPDGSDHPCPACSGRGAVLASP